LGSRVETINPKTKLVRFHSQLFNVDISQIEAIIAVADSPSLCGITISGDTAQSRLLFTPATSVTNFNSQTSSWDVTATVNLDGTFSATADVGLIISGTSFSADVTTKKISGIDEPHALTFQGVFSGTTGTFSNLNFTLTVGTATETLTVSGSFSINGDAMTGSGTAKVQHTGGTSNGTVTWTGARKK
jgi:hypothetical protein